MPKVRGGMTAKQEAFCREYIRNGCNGTQAAKDAGYKAKNDETFNSIAVENLQKPVIKAFIDAEMKRINSAKICSEKEALEIVSRIARGEANDDGKAPHESVRLRAADMLLKVNGTYAPERVEVTGNVDVTAVLKSRRERVQDAD